MQRLKVVTILSVGVFILAMISNSQGLLFASSLAAAADGTTYIYLPLISKSQPPPSEALPRVPRVNVPFFQSIQNDPNSFNQAAIFWFGKVDPNSNYVDVRVSYSPTELWIYAAIIDRDLWYDTSPSLADLTNWDSITLNLDLDGNVGQYPDTNSYRFVGQLNWYEPRTNYQAVFRGNGVGWSPAAVAFTTQSGYIGTTPNSGKPAQGWSMAFHLPFSSFGLSSAPPAGTTWGISLVLHDRDTAGGAMQPDESWPDNMMNDQPATWAQLHFGIPSYTPPNVPSSGSITLREGLNGQHVPDGGVGGQLGYLCPPDDQLSTWQQWGGKNFAFATGVNIANQSNLSDWPCFAKYYITFPLNGLPPNKVILSATLTLHEWGYAGNISSSNPDDRPKPSYIQVFTVNNDWSESTLTWNNGPQALENVSGAWVGVPADINSIAWPKYAWNWDVTRAVAQAYTSGQPLRLAFYEADSDYHSGKYFSTSDTEDWNADGRPTLVIKWGN